MNRIQVTETNVVGVMTMVNIADRIGVETTSLAFWVSLLTITTHRAP